MAFITKNVDWGIEQHTFKKIRKKYLSAKGVFPRNTSLITKIALHVMY
jgi:hypothetical protein